jgi:hypothetical protein
VQRRKKILSYFILSIYLLVVLHQSVLHTHEVALGETSSSPSHQHEEFDEVHHEHRFHVGIFHLLGHLLENINHSNNLADEHLAVEENTAKKQSVDDAKSVHFFNSGNNKVVSTVAAESLSDPPFYQLLLSHRLKQPNTPLRAPPALV